MLLAIWFTVYLQLSWECHAFTLTNYMGGAFMDQLERWELYFLHSLKHQLSKINWQPTGGWLLCLEKTRKFHVWAQSYSDTISVWGSSGLCLLRDWRTAPTQYPGKSRTRLCTLWIHHYCRSPILASAQASISSQSFTSILSQVWKQHIWTYLFGYQPILTHIHYSSSWVLAPEFTLQKKRGCTMYFTMHHNCANVSKFSVHKFTSFQWGTKGINMIVISSFLWKGHTSSLPFKLDCNFSDFLRW